MQRSLCLSLQEDTLLLSQPSLGLCGSAHAPISCVSAGNPFTLRSATAQWCSMAASLCCGQLQSARRGSPRSGRKMFQDARTVGSCIWSTDQWHFTSTIDPKDGSHLLLIALARAAVS
eukprot:5477213-Amphidinium_carterae.1